MVEIAFYKAENGKFFEKLMAWVQGSKFSHVEIVIDNFCYSSSQRDGGVRQKVINLHNGKWELFDMDIPFSHKGVRFFQLTNKYKYDWFGAILNLVFKLNRNVSPNRFYCSEWCIECLNAMLNENYNVNMSMNEFYNLIKQLGTNNE